MMETSPTLNTYIGMFSFESDNGDSGQFEVYTKSKSIHTAEQRFRKEIEAFLKSNELIAYPAKIFILDILEISTETTELVYNFSKISRDGSGIIFSSLPFRRSNAVAYSISEPTSKELFLIKGD